MPGLTAQLAAFVAGLERQHVPDEAARAVERGIADCYGVLFAGREEPVVALAAELAAIGPKAERLSAVLGDRGHAPAPDAALVDAVAAHALDYDDTGLDGHPSAVLAPVVMAQSARLNASGAQALTAYVAGYETWAELIGRDEDSHHDKGWHPTAVFGTVAAAAAGASLARLDATRTTHALGIAASMSAGIVANFGSMTKSLQVGFAARNGLIAVQLASRGVTSAPDALEHPRGLLTALSPAGRVRLDGSMRAGAPWQILEQGLSFKRYPVCYAAHRAIDAAISLHERVAHRLGEIESIVVELGRVQASMLRSHAPATLLDAKFSAEFGVAAALALGRLGLAELGKATLEDPAIRRLLTLVRIETTDERHARDPLFSPFDRVRLRLRSGEIIVSDAVERAKGHASQPLSDDELRAKFLDCARPSLGEQRALGWWRALIEFERGGVQALPATAVAEG